MIRKTIIILFLALAAQCVWRPQGAAITGTAFAATQENGQPCPPECVTDSMEIVTWYPSPYNEYEELRLYPTQRDDNYCDNDKIGLMYYDDGGTPSFPEDDKMRVCKGVALGWQEVGGGFWQQLSGNDISNTNSGVVSISKLKISTNAQAGYILTSDASGNASWQVSSGEDKFFSSQVFSSNGTFTIPSGVTKIMVEVWGAGGGGAKGDCTAWMGGGGGGGGGYGRATFNVSAGTSYSVVVGRKGGSGSCSGSDGEGSSFGSIVATGGKGAPNATGGQGGSSNASFSVVGGNGENSPGLRGGVGGDSYRSLRDQTPGGGGTGGEIISGQGQPGRDGGDGRVIVWY